MTERLFNFSAGPAVLPEPVLREAQDDLWNIAGSGVGILEHSHRGAVFDRVLDETIADCRALAGVPDDFEVLFLQGGASLQFAMVPMNFLDAAGTADYLNTGSWSKKAIKEAKAFGAVNVAASSEDRNFCYIPHPDTHRFTTDAAYCHFTSNNTIFGTQFRDEPRATAPLVCDASSDIFSKPIDFTRYGLIYAGAQKNLGPAGCALVLIRKDFLAAARRDAPTMLTYATHAESGSRYNTPNTFAVYLMGRVFKWIASRGGLHGIAEANAAKAAKLYRAIDDSRFYNATADADSRSTMNVCFRCADESLEPEFIRRATEAGLDGLKGHRSVGGMRASIYNAFPAEGVDTLVQFMQEFERTSG